MTQLTQNFTLEEFLRSGAATKKGYFEQFKPSAEVVQNLRELAGNILQPLRKFIGQSVFIGSGYRCARLNADVRGVSNSQHLTGEAADIQATGKMSNNELFQAIKSAKLPVDQCIVEFRDKFGEPKWTHVSYSRNPRGQYLEAYNENGITKYKKI